jgi:retinol dehydrogenase-14
MTSNSSTFVVTGATGGIGLAVCRSLALHGVRLLAVVRTEARGRELAQQLARSVPGVIVEPVVADLASLAAVRGAATEIARRAPRLQGLILNAAVVTDERELTVDGLERQFAVNHLAGFLLATSLVPALRAGAPSRVVVVASRASRGASIDLDNLSSQGVYAPTRVYATTKLENILFTRVLARRLAGTGVTVNALHPGVVKTVLLDTLIRHDDGPPSIVQRAVAPLRRIAGAVKRRILPARPRVKWWDTPEEAAGRVAYLALSPEVAGTTGGYFEDDRVVEGPPLSQDLDLAEALWARSERLVAAKPGGEP